MFLSLLNIIKGSLLLMGSYSNNVFLEPLSEKEEKEVVKRFLNGDMEARNTLIERNLRLVAHIVKKFDSKDNMTDDLISIGTIGLIKGIDTYKNNRKTKITTYASRCIQNEILMYFRANKKRNNDVLLSDSIGYDKEGNEINLSDIIEDKKVDYIELINAKDNIKYLKKYLELLKDTEKNIIIKRYGLNGTTPLTQKQIAQSMNISRSYVSRIEKRALTKILKEFIKDKKTL